MCGFTGYFTRPGVVGADALRQSLNAIAHRGPDDEGILHFSVADGELCLAHRRLSIIDLSASGHQPYVDHSGRYTMVYNGEVYNYKELREELRALGHQFFTNTDTEVVLEAWKAWGDKAWKRFTGMFSVVIYDALEKELVMVRDPFGIKPLYYLVKEGEIFFASEIPALVKLMPNSPELNFQRAFEYLMFYGAYDFDHQTFFRGVLQLMPAHYLRISLQKIKNIPDQKRWWAPEIGAVSKLSLNEASEELRRLFLESVRLHLRSDVPVGAALSGGLDSSAIVCAMRQLEPDMDINTFTYVARNTGFNEEVWADVVNSHVKAKANKVSIQPEELAFDLIDLIRTQGEPFSGTGIYAQYRIFKKAKEEGITVSLDGQGADELLAGYFGYPEKRIHSLLIQGKVNEAWSFSKNWSDRTGQKRLLAWRPLISEFLSPQTIFKGRKALGRANFPDWLNVHALSEAGVHLDFPGQQKFVTSANRKVMEQLANELIANRIPRLLRYADRNSMRFSIESRVPYLTTEMADFLYSLPEEYLISSSGESKHIFRRAMRNMVPDQILDRKDKIGYDTPQKSLLSSMNEVFYENLEGMADNPFFDKKILYKVYGKDTFQNLDANPRHWRVMNFFIWMNQFQVKI